MYYSATNITQMAYNYNTQGGIIFRNEEDYSSYRMNLPPNPTNCSKHIQNAKMYLQKENISYDCKALSEEDCQATYNDYYEKADPLSVFLRSSTCDLEWPQFGSVSQEELNFPLAYFITAYTDARNVELMLASIFRPHNSYCVHIDPKSDSIFSRTVLQLLYCYRARYPASYMDMAGSEVMLDTNKELVANLSSTEKPEIYTESFPMPENNMYRIKHKYQYKEGSYFDPDHASKDLHFLIS